PQPSAAPDTGPQPSPWAAAPGATPAPGIVPQSASGTGQPPTPEAAQRPASPWAASADAGRVQASPWAAQRGPQRERVTSRLRRVVEGLPDWEPLPPGETLVRRPGSGA
ncbi:hypothetical protein, partial [Streptomyces collinus]